MCSSDLLQLVQSEAAPDIQLVPVTLLWKRAPGREGRGRLQDPAQRQVPSCLRKALIVALHGRENKVRYSLPVSLRELVKELGTGPEVAHKLARVARIHFSRQRQAAKGPRLPDRQQMFRQLLRSENMVAAIAAEAMVPSSPLARKDQVVGQAKNSQSRASSCPAAWN